MEHERFITSTLNRKDVEAESTLRPQTFGSFPGQTKTKDRLEIYVSAGQRGLQFFIAPEDLARAVNAVFADIVMG